MLNPSLGLLGACFEQLCDAACEVFWGVWRISPISSEQFFPSSPHVRYIPFWCVFRETWRRSAFDRGGDGNAVLCGLGLPVASLEEEPELCGGRWSWSVPDGGLVAAQLGPAAGLCWAPLLGTIAGHVAARQDSGEKQGLASSWPGLGDG